MNCFYVNVTSQIYAAEKNIFPNPVKYLQTPKANRVQADAREHKAFTLP